MANRVELWIEDSLCDISEVDISIDYLIANVNNFGTRSGARSAAIDLPKTVNNKAIFESPEIVTNLTLKPYRRLKARLYVNGIDQLIIFATLETTKDFYSIRVYDVQTDFITYIKDLRVSDLSFCDLDHYWNFQNVIDGIAQTTGYTYPIVDYNSDSPNLAVPTTPRRIYATALYPALHYEDLIERIVTQANYTLSGANILPKECVLAYSGADLRRTTNAERYEVKIKQVGDTVVNTTLPSPATSSYYAHFGDCVVDGCDSFYNQTDYLLFPFADGVEFIFEWYLIVENIDGFGSDFNGFIEIGTDFDAFYGNTPKPDSYFIDSVTILNGQTAVISGSQFFKSYDETSLNIGKNTVTIVFSGGSSGMLEIKADSYVKISQVDITKPKVIEYDNVDARYNFFTVGTIMGDLTQGDVIKNYLLQTCSLCIVKEIDNEVMIVKFEDIVANINNAVNWTDKLDFTETTEIISYADGYGQNSHLKYQTDSGEVVPFGTNNTFNVDDENLPKDATIVESDFASSYNVTRLDGLEIPQIGALKDLKVSKELTQRCLYITRYDSGDLDPTGDLEVLDNVDTDNISTDIPIPYFIKDSETNNLGFGNSLQSEFYTQFIDTIDKYKMVKAKFRLNETDINQLDFTKPVYVEYFNSYFYINKISGYNPISGESSEVELIKLF